MLLMLAHLLGSTLDHSYFAVSLITIFKKLGAIEDNIKVSVVQYCPVLKTELYHLKRLGNV